MFKTKRFAGALLIIAPFIAFFYYLSVSNEIILSMNLENLVGIVAILSGSAGIIMSVTSARQASLDAVKDYFQQGDQDEFVSARRNIWLESDAEKYSEAEITKVCNFFHFWGLMNRKRYLPIWVFEGSSGIQTVEMYKKLEPIILKKRDENPFYATEYEALAKRIQRKYPGNFNK